MKNRQGDGGGGAGERGDTISATAHYLQIFYIRTSCCYSTNIRQKNGTTDQKIYLSNSSELSHPNQLSEMSGISTRTW